LSIRSRCIGTQDPELDVVPELVEGSRGGAWFCVGALLAAPGCSSLEPSPGRLSQAAGDARREGKALAADLVR